MENIMDWKTYEEVTKDIYEYLWNQSAVKIIGHGNSFKFKGKSDVEHKIDILTSHSDGIHSYLTDIECKYWDKNINKDIVMKVDSIVKDCNFNKVVIVSKLGFTPDAIKYAISVGVGLVILREPIEEDWEGRIKTIVLEINDYVPHITKFGNIAVEVYKDISGMVQTDRYIYHFNDGTKKTIKDYLEEFQKKIQDENIIIEIDQEIKFPEAIFLTDIRGDKIAKVIGIKMSGRLEVITTKNEINAEDSVWLMMKSILEEKTYVVSKTKEIRDVSQ
jgi:hypothetical protein